MEKRREWGHGVLIVSGLNPLALLQSHHLIKRCPRNCDPKWPSQNLQPSLHCPSLQLPTHSSTVHHPACLIPYDLISDFMSILVYEQQGWGYSSINVPCPAPPGSEWLWCMHHLPVPCVQPPVLALMEVAEHKSVGQSWATDWQLVSATPTIHHFQITMRKSWLEDCQGYSQGMNLQLSHHSLVNLSLGQEHSTDSFWKQVQAVNRVWCHLWPNSLRGRCLGL